MGLISEMVEEGIMVEEARSIRIRAELSRWHLEVAGRTDMPRIMQVDREETREDAFDECCVV